MLRHVRQDIDGEKEVSSSNESDSKDTFPEFILNDNQTFKDITLDQSDLFEPTPSIQTTRQWKPPQDDLADVMPIVDMVLSSKDNASTTANSQFLSSHVVESELNLNVNRPSSGSQRSTTSTGQLVIPSACYLAQPLTIAPVTSTSQQHMVESSCNFHQPLNTFFIQQTTSPESCSTIQSTPAQTFTSPIVDHQHPRSTL
ncbi:unnamed protein product [Mytilus coruscus]|uniref:Uncharacterized protein n=1 Tax=Mytilus coruscus TaxID=42192 RepID=A0A6J8BSR6_MYTCO|nr:unnamed protein product [Mytilus coruscus]